MGQKVNPLGFRLGITKTWKSKWYEERNYAKWLKEDLKIREFVKKEHYATGISSIEIERSPNKVKITVHTAKPGIVIGKRGAGVEKLKKDLQTLSNSEVILNIVEVRKPELDAQLVAEGVATQLERRVSFRRAMKKAGTHDPEVRGQGDPYRVLGALGRRGDEPPRVVPRGAGAFAHAACGHQLRLRDRADDLRGHRREGVDLPW